MDKDQRGAIRKALNGDVEKVLEQCDRSDPQLRRLERETFEVNQLFDEFERQAAQDEHRAIDVKMKEEKCADQLHAFENLRDQILEYLSQNEKLIEVMEPVAVDMEMIKTQLDELKVVCRFSFDSDKITLRIVFFFSRFLKNIVTLKQL